MTIVRVLQYRLSDGSLSGLWEGAESYLLAQVVEDDPTFGYLLLTDDHPAVALTTTVILERWAVVADVLTEKVVLEITAAPTPFAADGLEECLITVDPFVECTLLVNGAPMALTTGDATLGLTSDVPATFMLALQPMVTHWAAPLTVEAS